MDQFSGGGSETSDVALQEAENTEDLIRTLLNRGYQVITFPGCTESIREYLHCYNKGHWPVEADRVEGFGLTFRLFEYENPRVGALIDFLNVDEFKQALEAKFGISRENRIETAIQKYLAGYEISPHPDIRSKCLTYLLNINTTDESEKLDIHTHLLDFKPEKRFIKEFWKYNTDIDTDWVPWDWCETKKLISRNNSLIMFQPSYDTLHAIRLRYDHLKLQRTQIYGNLWHTDVEFLLPKVPYSEFEPKAEDISESWHSGISKRICYYASKIRNIGSPWPN